MPNWCENEITWNADFEGEDKVLKFVESENSFFDFEKISPYPEKFALLDKEYEKWQKGGRVGEAPESGYREGGYEWCLKNWGTKWNADSIAVDNGVASFLTAWSPPSPIVRALSKYFPDLTFTLKYEEGGMDFSGYEIYKNGKLLEEKNGNFNEFSFTGGSYHCAECDEYFPIEDFDTEKNMCISCRNKT